MPTRKIDTLIMLIADQGGGKSNQLRSIFEEFELYSHYSGYPVQNKIKGKYYVHPDMDLYLKLGSWHENGQNYTDVVKDLETGNLDNRRRYKVLVPAQVTATPNLVEGEKLFIDLFTDFEIRRGFAIWLSPDCSTRKPFSLSPRMTSFLSTRKHISALAIDALASHPSAAPQTNCINARLITDLLFRV